MPPPDGKREGTPLEDASPKRVKAEETAVENMAPAQSTPLSSAPSLQDGKVEIDVSQSENINSVADANQPMDSTGALHASSEPIEELPKYTLINQLPRITPANLERLMTWLEEKACAKDDDYVEMEADNNNFLQADEEVIDEMMDKDNVAGETQDKDKEILEELRIQRDLMGVLLPENNDLEQICNDLGIDTEDIDWREGIRLPHMDEDAPAAKPHQITGANWICDTLNSPIRAAILADECGIGKTLQIGIALLIHYLRVKAAIRDGTFRPLDPSRKFRPSIIFCPSSATISHQIVEEFSKWFRRFFRLKLCHGYRLTCEDDFIRPFILNNEDELQDWVDTKAKAHEDPEACLCHLYVKIFTDLFHKTLRSIVIVTYSTAIRRMTFSGRELWDQEEELKQEQEGNAPNLNDVGPGAPRCIPKKRKVFKKKKVVLKITNAKFNWVVCDEGHATRNPRTSTHKLIKLLDREATLIVSATPLLNHQRDMWGYVNLLWRREWPFRYEETIIDPQVYYKEEAWNTMEEDRSFEGLTMKKVLNALNDERGAQLSLPEQKIRTEFVNFIRNKWGPLFLLNPDLYDSLRKSLEHSDAHISQKAIKPLLKMLCIRRRMLSELTLPDGSVVMPSDDIRPMWLRTIRTQASEGHKNAINKIIARHMPSLLRNSDGPPEDLGHGTIDQGTSLVMDTGIFRTLSMSTTTLRCYRLTRTDVADSKKLNEIIKEDRTKTDGIPWYYTVTRGGQDPEYPQSREEVVMTLCCQSPKLCWALYRILDLRKQKRRVLVYINHPLTSMIMTALLKTIEVETMSIRTSLTQLQRANVAHDFNSSSSNVEVLRMGQKHDVYWDIVYLENSFDGWLETNMSLKCANILAAEGEIPREIKGEYRTICGFELIKMHLGQNCNRYPRVRVAWAEKDEDSVTREGHFYSAVAQYLMENPSHHNKFPQDDLSEIASRWNPELRELTLDMIEGRAPVLEDGVVLDSRNPENSGSSSDVSMENSAVSAVNKGWEERRLERERARRI
ncbi:hypothetical protein FHETE_877 [Fusarium heterosporum]|uniref:Helicase ATP-binding domain-containing protein n=1 Tax=Fusarium heterosporum TaxID=42747 RepID=A0A8H5X224_FUSHE|nr:hypothetical protein FHETE_877 [Fusarium heterosporum]